MSFQPEPSSKPIQPATQSQIEEAWMTPVTAEPQETATSALTKVEQSRAVQEVQAMLIIAKRFPRDEVAAHVRIMRACQRPVLAEQAMYSLPIGGKNHRGPSIRLAEVLAQAWGNVSFGIKEIGRSNGRSQCIAYCFDQETNTKAELEFEVEHWMEVGRAGNKTRKPISDPVEIDRLIANRGARKLRNCILQIIPGDVVDEAVKACHATLAKGGGEPLIDRIRKMVTAFAQISVTQEMIEARLGHTIDKATADNIVDLASIYKTLIDKQGKRDDFFSTGQSDRQSSSLNDKLKGDSGNKSTTVEEE